MVAPQPLPPQADPQHNIAAAFGRRHLGQRLVKNRPIQCNKSHILTYFPLALAIANSKHIN